MRESRKLFLPAFPSCFSFLQVYSDSEWKDEGRKDSIFPTRIFLRKHIGRNPENRTKQEGKQKEGRKEEGRTESGGKQKKEGSS